MVIFIKQRIYYLFEFVRNMYYLVVSKFVNGDRILLLPPAAFTGSFGDELMAVSFVEHYKHEKIDIYTDVKREDLFQSYRHVNFIERKNHIKWYKYKSLNILGADVMTGSYGESYPLYIFKLLQTADRFGIKSKILGFSLKKNNSPRLVRNFINISKKTDLALRDLDSYDRANQLGLKNTTLVSDLAFLTPYEDLKDEPFEKWLSSNSHRKIIGICPNALHALKIGLEEYIAQFSKFINHLQGEHLAFLFLYHDIRHQVEGDSDRSISLKIFESLDKDVASYYTSTAENGVAMKYYISKCNMTVTGRMHFGISGLSVGIPMFGINYEDKFSGLQKLFEILPEESLLDYTLNISENYLKVLNFIHNIDHYEKLVLKNLPEVKNLVNKNFT